MVHNICKRCQSVFAVLIAMMGFTINLHAVTLVRYVNDDATAGGNGQSWNSAYKHLQDAMTWADTHVSDNLNDTVQLWVASGTYRPDETSTNPTGSGDRAAHFELLNRVQLYGGFVSGDDELSDRNPTLNITILSGAINTASIDDNSYHVVYCARVEAARIDGFRITAGNADGEATYFQDVGGGMFNHNGDPIILRCTFLANHATSSGGGLHTRGDALSELVSPKIVSCSFLGNAVDIYGGGFGNYGSTAYLINCEFSGNTTANDAGRFSTVPVD